MGVAGGPRPGRAGRCRGCVGRGSQPGDGEPEGRRQGVCDKVATSLAAALTVALHCRRMVVPLSTAGSSPDHGIRSPPLAAREQLPFGFRSALLPRW